MAADNPGKFNFNDELIREALRYELSEVNAPPPEPIWQQIKERLQQEPPANRRRFYWSRYAAAAAAVLLLLVGGLSIFRATEKPFPDGKPFLASDQNAEQLDGMFAENEAPPAPQLPAAPQPPQERVSPAEGWVKQPPGREETPAYFGWPAQVGDNYHFEQLYSRRSDAKDYTAALYSGNGRSFLWIQVTPPAVAQDWAALVKEWEADLGVSLEVIFKSDREIIFRDELGLLGLAWRGDGRDELLWDQAGSLTEEALRELYEWCRAL